MSSLLLHPEYLRRVPLHGRRYVAELARRAEETRAAALAVPVAKDFGVSVIIRTKNDAATIGGLLDNLRANQEFFSGPVQLVVVDTESTDNTLAIVRRYKPFFDLNIISIKQADFNYALSLNLGFKAAKHEFVLTLVGHSALCTKVTLLAARRFAKTKKLCGLYGAALPNANASRSELLAAASGFVRRFLSRGAKRITRLHMGVMAANCSMVRRSAWEQLGGYDERYGAGGEDGDFARRAVAQGLAIWREPVVSVHHTHGLGFVNAVRQVNYWRKIAKPYDFDEAKLAKYRPDLNLPR